MARKASKSKKYSDMISAFALGYPETHVDHPWGETALKVKGKVFVFVGEDKDGSYGFSVKLPQSLRYALEYPFCEPTHYGLGKSGWVTASFKPDDEPPMDLVKRWIDESYRAVASKTLVKALDGGAPAKKVAKRKTAKKKAAKKVTTKKKVRAK